MIANRLKGKFTKFQINLRCLVYKTVQDMVRNVSMYNVRNLQFDHAVHSALLTLQAWIYKLRYTRESSTRLLLRVRLGRWHSPAFHRSIVPSGLPKRPSGQANRTQARSSSFRSPCGFPLRCFTCLLDQLLGEAAKQSVPTLALINVKG